MAAVTTVIAAVGLGVSAASAVGGMVSAKRQAEAGEDAEKARQRAANLDAQRRKRAVIREAAMQRSVALSNATVQGAEAGSGLQGAYGSVAGQSNNNISGITQQQELGNQVFAANARAQRASSQSATWDGIGSLGGALTKNAGMISNIGSYLFGDTA
jgi:hypothetical protein